MLMNLPLLTTLSIHVAFVAAISESESYNANIKVMPELIGADQLAGVSAHCEGCQPDYCYEPTPADYFCYKDGYPSEY